MKTNWLGNLERFLSGRHPGYAVGIWFLAAMLGIVFWYVTPQTHLFGQFNARGLPTWEYIPVSAACFICPLLGPRVPLVEAIGARALWPYSLATGTTFVALIGGLPAIAYLVLSALPVNIVPNPGRAYIGTLQEFTDVVSRSQLEAITLNVVFLAGAALAFTAIFGPRLGPVVYLGTYVALVVMQSLEPFASILPLPGAAGTAWMVTGPAPAVVAASASLIGIATWTFFNGMGPMGRRLRSSGLAS